jgi:hypothetical protein
MNKTGNELITKLVEEKDYSPSSKTFLISLYIDAYGAPRSDVYTVLNSYLKKGFSKVKELKKKHLKRDEVQVDIERELDVMESFNRGVGIFAKFSLENKETEIKIFDSPVQFTNDVFVGKVYKVDQLVWASNLITTSLVINLERKEASINELRDDIFSEVEVFENKYIDPEAREYQEKFRPTVHDKVLHGTGDIGKQREAKEDNRRFFMDVYETFKERFEDLSGYEYVVLFHSDSYDPLVEEMKETITNDYNVDLVLKSVQPDEIENLGEKAKEVIRDLKKDSKIEHLEISKSVPDRYAEGFKEVADASRFRKIDTIYVKKGVKKSGYIANDNLIYTYPVKDSDKVKDISPWLFKNVLENSGQLYVFEDDFKKLKKQISGRLRF